MKIKTQFFDLGRYDDLVQEMIEYRASRRPIDFAAIQQRLDDKERTRERARARREKREILE